MAETSAGVADRARGPVPGLEPNAIGVVQDTVIGMASSAPAATVGLNQPEVMGNVPGWCPSTTTRPAIAKPSRIAHSVTPIAIWARAVILMPTIAITSMTSPTAAAMAKSLPGVSVPPNTVISDGPMTSTALTVPMM